MAGLNQARKIEAFDSASTLHHDVTAKTKQCIQIIFGELPSVEMTLKLSPCCKKPLKSTLHPRDTPKNTVFWVLCINVQISLISKVRFCMSDSEGIGVCQLSYGKDLHRGRRGKMQIPLRRINIRLNQSHPDSATSSLRMGTLASLAEISAILRCKSVLEILGLKTRRWWIGARNIGPGMGWVYGSTASNFRPTNMMQYQSWHLYLLSVWVYGLMRSTAWRGIYIICHLLLFGCSQGTIGHWRVWLSDVGSQMTCIGLLDAGQSGKGRRKTCITYAAVRKNTVLHSVIP